MKLINEFKEQCETWNNQRTDDLSAIYNTNNEQLVIQNIKYILVGDNPGDTECDNNEYFLGKAGIVTRLFFEQTSVKMTFLA